MNYRENILGAIGRTPLVRLNKIAGELPVLLLGKLEALNPGGSVKDRIGVAMIEAAERDGRLKPGGTIVEATAGNTGVGLAQAAAVKGYRCVFVLPDKMSEEKIRLLEAYGAEVVITPTNVPPDSPQAYNNVADRLAREIPNAFRPDQFSNPANPEIHFRTTAAEIWEDTDGKLDVFVAGAGTGGTISGIGRYLKARSPKVRVVVADPEGSILSGDAPRAYHVEGIGEDFIPANFDRQVVDDFVRVGDREAFHTARRLAREEGLLVGGSSGAAVAAAVRYSQRLEPGKTVVALLPDTGRNYLSKLFSDDWMRARGFIEEAAARVSAGDVLREKRFTPLIATEPACPVSEAVSRMHQHGISHLPVIDAGRLVGGIDESGLVRLLRDGAVAGAASARTVGEVMGRPAPQVDACADVAEVSRLLLAGHPLVVVSREGAPAGVLTCSDLVSFWTRPKEVTP